MAGERYIDRAVSSLAAYLAATVPAALRAIETEQGLSANTLRNPVAYTTARVPNDLRTPLVKVYDEGGEFVSQRNRLLSVDCSIEVSLTGDANSETLEANMRRYATAIIDAVTASPTLAGRVEMALLQDYGAGVTRGDQSSTRIVFVQGVTIHVQETR